MTWILTEVPGYSPCFFLNQLLTFAVSPTVLHHHTLGTSKFPLFIGEGWGSMNYSFLLVHSVFFDEGLSAPGPPKRTSDTIGIELSMDLGR